MTGSREERLELTESKVDREKGREGGICEERLGVNRADDEEIGTAQLMGRQEDRRLKRGEANPEASTERT